MLSHTGSVNTSESAIVYLHAAGISGWMWSDVIQRLPQFGFLNVDLPGHGGSRNLHWESIEQTAQAVWAMVDHHAQGRPVHLVGLSLGAYVGLTTMSLRPNAVASAVLSGMHAQQFQHAWLYELFARLMAPLQPRAFMARRTAALFGLSGDDVELFVEEAGKTRTSAVRRTIVQVIDYAPPVNLADIRTRVLFVAGADEHRQILESLAWLADSVPNGRAAIAAASGHGWAGQHPEVFAQTVYAHLSNTALPAGLSSPASTTCSPVASNVLS